MPSNLTFPGVYIEEIPSNVRTIVGVATSITAFFGMALRGPTDDPVVINSFGDFERVFGGLWVDSSLGYAVKDFYLNGGSQAIVVRLQRNATAADITIGGLLLAAANAGRWGNNLSVTIDHNTKDPANNKLFNMQVVEVDPVTQQQVRVENLLNVSVDPADARFVPLVVRDDSQLIVVKKDNLGNWSVPVARPGAGTTQATAASGADGLAINQGSFVGGTLEADKRGLFALEKADLFNLLCIPPYLADGNVDTPLIEQASAYCEKKRAMLLIDPPAAWDTVAEVIAGLPNVGPTSKNAAIFFPRLRQPNPLRENKLEDFVPCGAVAGVFARTDAQRGVWKAPAGLDATLTGVPQLTVSLTNEENGQLNPLGVNCLRTMPAVGRVVWGSRTRRGNDQLASEWKYVPVRRTALFIEETLYRALQWVVFEPNDEPLWAQVRLNVGAFMNSLFRQGAFQGQSPREAYFVKCDKDTTTQNDIDRGIVNILVGFAPLKPAEFVVIKLQQIAGQIQT
ncbi:MAG TPA: phage tail sheath C-terminal domain-containing protein [Pyrinomonadaceae bacterium]|nr:phage tail sheath C-terminal domain-containing protein [Pyrinomonadaceae bacterium]